MSPRDPELTRLLTMELERHLVALEVNAGKRDAETLEATRAVEHLAGVLEHDATRRGQLRAPSGAFEELDGERRLERLHGVADRRRRAVEMLRGGGETAEAIDGFEDLELVERELERHGDATVPDRPLSGDGG